MCVTTVTCLNLKHVLDGLIRLIRLILLIFMESKSKSAKTILDATWSNLHCCQDVYLVFEVLEAPSAACGGTFKGRWNIWSNKRRPSKPQTRGFQNNYFFWYVSRFFSTICIHELFMTSFLRRYSCIFCWCLFYGNSELFWLLVFHIDGFWCGFHAFCTDFFHRCFIMHITSKLQSYWRTASM